MASSNVLTTTSIIHCPHHGKLLFTGVSHKLKVQGNPVLLKSDIGNATVSTLAPDNCIQQDSTNPPQKKCTKVYSVTGGESSKLTVGKVPVMLQGMTGYTDGFPPPQPPPPPPATGGNMTVDQVQSKLTAV